MPRDDRLTPIYTVFAAFIERCLLNDRSLLWPEREVWTIAALEEARRRFVEGYLQGRMSFRAKLEAQLGGAPPEVWALFADAFYIYGLPSRTIRTATKRDWVEWSAKQAGLDLPADDDLFWQALQMGFAATGQKYNFKHAQLRLLILMALEIKAAPGGAQGRAALLGDPAAMQALLDGILETIPVRLDRANDMRSAILYMAFPEQYEPILSSGEKDAILQHYAPQVEGRLPDDRDATLRVVRAALEPRLGPGFDFHGEAREEWRPPPAALLRALGEQRDETGRPARLRERAGTAYRGAPETAPDPDLLRVLEALRLSRNVILSGPPGTGKTYIAWQAARRLTEEPGVPAADSGRLQWVTLHPSYAYEDFVEGLRPAVAEGAARPPAEGAAGPPVYEVRPGVFRELCERAAADPERAYVLVLDEINRANLAKILGELVTLIEDDRRGRLRARLPYSGAQLSVPPNLLLLGTMNTADRSIALLDAALRRRFVFVELEPRPDLLAGAVVETDEAVLQLDALMRCLNAAILEHFGPDGRERLLGHSYFLRVARVPAEERLAALELVWNGQILPLLEEYFYARRDRLAEILAPFVDEAAGPLAAREIARLNGEELVVALSRLCK